MAIPISLIVWIVVVALIMGFFFWRDGWPKSGEAGDFTMSLLIAVLIASCIAGAVDVFTS